MINRLSSRHRDTLRFPGSSRRQTSIPTVGVECGGSRASPAARAGCPRLTDGDMALAVSARNLALAERRSADLIVLCNATKPGRADHGWRDRADESSRANFS
jgi:hypothetical protein